MTGTDTGRKRESGKAGWAARLISFGLQRALDGGHVGSHVGEMVEEEEEEKDEKRMGKG